MTVLAKLDARLDDLDRAPDCAASSSTGASGGALVRELPRPFLLIAAPMVVLAAAASLPGGMWLTVLLFAALIPLTLESWKAAYHPARTAPAPATKGTAVSRPAPKRPAGARSRNPAVRAEAKKQRG